MQLTALKIPDVLLIVPRKFSDDRGCFMETFRKSVFASAVGNNIEFVQENHSFSAKANTVRGLHFQSPPKSQGKLVRCTAGAIVDVAVDVRKNSSTHGQWVSALLSAENSRQIFVPAGFLHGFATLIDNCEVQYKCTNYYDADSDGNVLWNDPALNIDWGLEHGFDPLKAVLSDKDIQAAKFSDWHTPF